MKFAGKKVLVTGAAQGIGEGITRHFLQQGAAVAALDYRQDQLADLRKQYAADERYHAVVCDLREPAAAKDAVAEAWDKLGGLDIVVNNAGIARLEPIAEITDESWNTMMNVNLNAMFVICREIARRWQTARVPGVIVNMASKNGLFGQAKLAHYNTSKGGVILLTQTLAVELGPLGIRVNAIAPGFIETPMDRETRAQEKDPTVFVLRRTPLGRYGTIDEVAKATLFLASDDASYITGTTLLVDGGHIANSGAM